MTALLQPLALGLSKRVQALRGLLSWRSAKPAGTVPVRDWIDVSTGQPTRLQGFDQALIWVVVALVALGLVMVYSASVALPDNPKFARYTPTYFLTRHIISIAIATLAALVVVQIPIAFWEKICSRSPVSPGAPSIRMRSLFRRAMSSPWPRMRLSSRS